MKKRILLVSVLASFLAAGAASAQTGHEAMQAEQGAAPPPAAAPGMMMGGKMGQGGMMGGGMGGMMGGGQGMMGGGGQGMMGGGMCGMMGPGMGSLSPEAHQKFLDATKELRKKLNDKQFEYAEAARNPKADKKELLKKRKELWDVQQKIHEKAWSFMTE